MIRNTVCFCNLKLLWSISSLLFSCQHCPLAEVVLSLSSAFPHPALLVEHNALLLCSAARAAGSACMRGCRWVMCFKETWTHVLVSAGAGGGTVGIRTNSSPLSCSCAISLLGSGKMEENKENDLRPPLPQSYAATVARQSTVPSTSTMPGKHRICPSSGRSKKASWGKGESPSFQGFNQTHHLCNETGAAGLLRAHPVHFQGPLPSASPPCAELHHKRAHQQ